jgi:hypothetical protein
MHRPTLLKHTRFDKLTTDGYVCPSCRVSLRKSSTLWQPRRTFTNLLPKSEYPTRVLRKKNLTQGAYFHTSSRRADLEQQPISTSNVTLPGEVGELPIRRHWGRDLVKQEHHLPGRSFIRDELRAWSVKNEKTKKENAPEGIAETGRVKVLPEALFIEDVEETGGEDDDEFAEYDDSVEGGNKVQLEPGDVLDIRLYGCIIL